MLYELSREGKEPPKVVECYTDTQRFHSLGAVPSVLVAPRC